MATTRQTDGTGHKRPTGQRRMRMTNRNAFHLRKAHIALALVLMLVVAACGAPGGSEASSDEGPITVGVIVPTTGVVAAAGTDMLNGWNLYWELNGNEVAGRTIETIHEDNAGEPTNTLTKARKLVEQDGASVIVGTLLANTALALAEYVDPLDDVIGLNPAGSADDLSQRGIVDNYVRAGGWQSSSPTHVAGNWAYDQGYRRIITLCQDYAFGHENCGGFINTFTDRGGEVVQQLWAPLGTPDYSSYLSDIDPQSADAAFVLTVGADSGRFVKQWSDFGLKDELPLIGGETTLDQSLLRAMGDEAIGLESFGHYAEGREDAATQEFVDAYLEAYDLLPSYYAASTYTAAQWFVETLETEDGDMSDIPAFLETLKAY
ncbi:MAG: ABC transporter substrate-binding protein, partial [Actinobacteria bacterium]|nr:ABC transporter substrate-binding protein [Actinomycetota bacterium]